LQITVTIGPSSIDTKILNQLKEAGAKRFRVNLSHSSDHSLIKYFNELRSCNIVPCIDTQGPQIRTKEFNKPELQEKEVINIFFDENNLNLQDSFITLTHQEAFNQIDIGDIIRLDFNGLSVKVLDKCKGNFYKAKVLTSGILSKNKGVDIIGKSIYLPILTEFDKKSIRYALDNGCNTVFASFVSNANQAEYVKNFIGRNCKLISKIETANGVSNIDEIIDISDEILIDRGDLSRETSIPLIPIATSKIIECATKKGCPVNIATNILDSMMTNSMPSRAEVSDIFNLLNRNVEGIVLAAEVAIGENPVSSTALVNYLMKVYQNYKKGFIGIGNLEKPSKNLIGEELYNWI
tara:strand:+ start:50956 stop:52008 length:1053 start_codon:yes stop_codon:yes gene_type:complete